MLQQQTNYEKWLTAMTCYEVQYAPMYEPFMIAPMGKIPSYNTAFQGVSEKSILSQ
jgi:hypothetical protein